jgi:hypothetical protein
MAANILNSPQAVEMNTTCGNAVGWTAPARESFRSWSHGDATERSGDREPTFLPAVPKPRRRRVIRAFVKMRETLLASPDLAKKLALLEKKLTGRLDVHEAAIVKVQRYLIDFELSRDMKNARIRSVWIVRKGANFPRLVTCYVI